MYYFRAFSVWLLIIIAESIHGTIRQIFLSPVLGDYLARRIAVFTGMILIFVITTFCINWIDAPTKMSLLGIGLMWVILTILFEFSLGIFVFNYSWERIFEDYNILQGGLMVLGLLFMMFTPFLSKRLMR